MALAGLPCHLPGSHPSKPLEQLVPHIPAPAAPGLMSVLPVHPHLLIQGHQSAWDSDSVLSHPTLSTLLPPHLMLLQHT